MLDATSDESPVPTIRTKETLDTLTSGQVLKVVTSKESTIKNIKTLVANNPFELLDNLKNVEGFVFFIKKL
ncbi:MAG: sulfurtransferase TusA family protein [Methylotenera sp.]|nr:sulfurtransferase TusA family protein [Methylotenera sp.]MDP1754272.1 sulfurtransferase TusA family protein [Methylotenera sp.]MDP1959774.1 sulfurtransferase TusA family protein [Methylotenera sp.]MDP3206435.1 sulfurtransferase TusA family protein [Methylotenera sp.]MDP3303251.1 sulfurtransferase TusA family protein [Methylotenera sp.]